MKLRRTDVFLIFAASISFIVFCISFAATERMRPKPVESALLNPSARDKISLAIIQDSALHIVLKSVNGKWLCESNGVTVSADTKLVSSFLEKLSKIRKMYKISDRKDTMSELGLKDEDAKSVVLLDSEGKTAVKLCFGQENALTSRIAVASSGGKVSYETENDISSYLSADINFWAAPEIFFAIRNPSNLNLSDADLHTLLSLRHGKILARANLPLDAEKAGSVTLMGQYNASQRVDFYRNAANGINEYYYIQEFFPDALDFNALYEISEWTYSRIMGLLSQK